MSDVTVGTIIASIPTIITSVVAAVAAIVAVFKGIDNGKKSDVAAAKTDVLVKKTEEIHTLTNSNMNKISTELQVANAKIAGLEKLVTTLQALPVTIEKKEGG